MAFSFSPKVVTDGLVLNIDAANSKSYISGSTLWNDLTATTNNISLINTPQFDSLNGGSIKFNGSNNYGIIQYNTVFDSLSFSVSGWFKIDGAGSSTSHYVIASDAIINTGAQGIGIFYEGYITRLIGDVTTTTNGFGWDVRPFSGDGKWHHFCATYDSSITTSYIYGDGIRRGTEVRNIGRVFTQNRRLIIGARTTSDTFFNGKISNLQLYNRALSSTEVLQNYNALKGRFGLT